MVAVKVGDEDSGQTGGGEVGAEKAALDTLAAVKEEDLVVVAEGDGGVVPGWGGP